MIVTQVAEANKLQTQERNILLPYSVLLYFTYVSRLVIFHVLVSNLCFISSVSVFLSLHSPW